jgi:hypothetical protein
MYILPNQVDGTQSYLLGQPTGNAGCKAVATCLQVHGFYPDSIIRYSQNHNDMEGANNNESRNRSTELLL